MSPGLSAGQNTDKFYTMSLTHKQRMLNAIQGRPNDQLPWAPRLDLWFKANQRSGTLPPAYPNASLMELTDAMDVGFHAVVPDFRDLRQSADDADRALGLYNLWPMPYRTVLENVERRVSRQGDKTTVEYATPRGNLRTTVIYDEAMRRAGVSITHIAECAVKSHRDYPALGFIFENARVEPNDDGFREFAARVGERGLPVGFISLAASPMHLLQRELMPVDLFFLEMYDHPDELAELAAQIDGYWRRLLAVAAASPAEVFLLGANYDATVTYPPFFERHIRPWLSVWAAELHRRGKYLLTHTDGENTGLLEHYLQAQIDIADSVCPKPMTKLSLKNVRDAFAGRITIMGGIPSVALLKASLPDRDFERFMDDFFAQIGSGDHLILGISDTTPPAADFNRLLRIGERARNFGPVRKPV